MNSTDKGDIGVLHVSADLVRQGLSVCKPISESAPYDLVVVKESGEFDLIQVKYRTAKDGVVNVRMMRMCFGMDGPKFKEYGKSDFDVLAIYCPELNGCFYIRKSELGKSVTLRLNSTKNNQEQGVRQVSDFTEYPA